jgi:hypothetical protein
LDKGILHALLSSDSLRVTNEDELLQTLFDLGWDYFEFWNYLEIGFLSDSGLACFVTQLPFCSLSAEIWSQFVSILSYSESKASHSYRFTTPSRSFDSLIVSSFPSVLRELTDENWELLYRGSRDGYTAGAFHAKCDAVLNTVTVILTSDGAIFGGFTPIPWESGNGHYKEDPSGKSFVFVVKNLLSLTEKRFALTFAPYAIYCNSGYGPTFGCHSIHVANACNANSSSYIDLGLSYSGDAGIAGARFFRRRIQFTVKEIEVFKVGSCEKRTTDQ